MQCTMRSPTCCLVSTRSLVILLDDLPVAAHTQHIHSTYTARTQHVHSTCTAQQRVSNNIVPGHPCLPKGTNRTLADGFIAHGTGDFEGCYEAVRRRLQQLCSGFPIGSPHCGHSLMVAGSQAAHERWFALSGFGHLAEFLSSIGIGDASLTGPVKKHGNSGTAGVWGTEKLHQATQELCAIGWPELLQRGHAAG